MTAFAAGQILHASDLIRILPVWVIKAADESVNSGSTGTTLQNDNELLAAVSASTNYRVDFALLATEAASNVIDIKCAWTMPSGCTLDLAVVGPHTAWTGAAANQEVEFGGWQNETSSPTSTKNFGTGSGVNLSYHFRGTLRVGGSSGTFQFQWAQANSNASNLTVKAGSSLTLTPLLS